VEVRAQGEDDRPTTSLKSIDGEKICGNKNLQAIVDQRNELGGRRAKAATTRRVKKKNVPTEEKGTGAKKSA